MGYEIIDMRGVGADFMGQMVVYLAMGPNPLTTEEQWNSYQFDPGFMPNTPRGTKFDVLVVLGSPFKPTGEYTFLTDSQGYTWEAVAAVANRAYPFDPDDYAGFDPPVTSSAEAGYVLTTPLPGTIQYNSNDKNHENIYYAEDGSGNPQIQYYVTDPWGNVYILKSVNLANDTPEKVAAAVADAVLPEGWVKSSGYLDSDFTFVSAYSGEIAHANEFRDSADSAWTQIVWGKSGKTLAAAVGDGMPIWGGNSGDLLKGTSNDDEMHGAAGNDQIRGREGHDQITGDNGKDELHGAKGKDQLYGGNGKDFLIGGRGADQLDGGPGADKLKGGRGSDLFIFNEASKGDKILDFERGKDLIDLSGLDADISTSGDDAFVFIGRRPFTGEAGEVRYQRKDGDSIVKGDLDGNGKADFSIVVADMWRLHESDFVL